MFTLEGKLTFINIDQNYLKKLYDICSEVYYKPSGYENKPYIGILINKDDRKYVIPLSSAKKKHKTWKNVDKECYLVYETAKKSCMGQSDIWVPLEEDNVKHILSVMDIKKMIPIVDGVYSRVNINPEDSDTDDVKKYKDLLNKEYSFCLKVISVCLLSRYLQLTTLTSAPVMPESEQIQKSAKYSPLNPEQIHHEYG